MTKAIFAAIGAALLSTACHHFAPTETVSAKTQLIDTVAIEAFAVDAVYAAHPTRALVDSVIVTPTAVRDRYIVHVEMTGGEAFRDIFDIVVVEHGEGELELVSLEQVQGG